MRGGIESECPDTGPEPAASHSTFSIGGVCVRVAAPFRSDAVLTPFLIPFQVGDCVPDIAIRVERVTRFSAISSRPIFDSNSVWRLYEDDTGLQFDFTAPIFGELPYKRLLVDRSFRRAILQLRQEFFSEVCCEADPLGYPLDELLIMHRLTQEPAIEVHGVGVVGPNGMSNLFVGHSGAGKSTTARLWATLDDVKILSDDRIILRRSPTRDLQPSDNPLQIFMYGTPWHGEASYALPDRAALQRIFILEHGRGNRLGRLTRSQAVSELFARSFVPFYGHEPIESALSFLEVLAESIPCYRYSFEPDARAVEKILQFHD